MIYTVIDFIKQYYSQILTVIVIAVIIVMVLITLLKKPKDGDKKQDISLSLQKEREFANNLKVYAKSWVIMKKDIQDYYLILIDKYGTEVYTSNMYASIIGARQDIKKISYAIENDAYKLTHDIDNNYMIIYLDDKNRQLGRTKSIENLKGVESYVLDLKTLMKEVKENDSIIKNFSQIDFEKIPKSSLTKHRKDGWKIDTISDSYSGRLYNESNELILVTMDCIDKKECKKEIDKLSDAIKMQNFVIDKDEFNKYHFYLRGLSRETLFISKPYLSLEEVTNAIKETINCA